MKKYVFVLLFCMGAIWGLAQSDTVFTQTKTLVGKVREVGIDEVKFSFGDEDLVNIISKNVITRIVYHSGRVEVFEQAFSLRTVASADDWEKVSLCQVESEVKGLFRLGDVASKAKGTFEISDQEKIKQRAIKKLKIETAMLGGNVVYMTDVRTQGNIQGTRFRTGQTSEASFFGIAYSSSVPNYQEFLAMLGDQKDFVVCCQTDLNGSNSNRSDRDMYVKAHFNKVYTEGGFIMIDASVEGVKQQIFRITYFDKEYFTLMYRDKNDLYNFYIYWNN